MFFNETLSTVDRGPEVLLDATSRCREIFSYA